MILVSRCISKPTKPTTIFFLFARGWAEMQMFASCKQFSFGKNKIYFQINKLNSFAVFNRFVLLIWLFYAEHCIFASMIESQWTRMVP